MISDDARNFWNTFFNPFHTLFCLYQFWKRRRYADYFDTILTSPLTKQQRRAIILNERRNLVVAGAGTGKTATVVGKVGYLVESKKCSPNEILVIAYNNSAAKEIRDRLSDRLGIKVESKTFHTVGTTILRDSSFGFKFSEFLDQPEKLKEFLGDILDDCLKTKKTRDLYTRFFSKYEFLYKDEHESFGSYREYCSWVRTNYFLTLNGERTKSFGELLIANFLYVNGVPYNYEREYSPNNNMPKEGSYRPDFYIPETKTYIEYFGTDESGNTAPYIDSEEYNRQMAWKIETHRKGNTRLIQLFYHQNRDGVMLDALRRALKNSGVKFERKTSEQILEKINESNKNKKFVELLIRFLEQYQENQSVRTISGLRSRVKNDERSLLFMKIFEIVHEHYANKLRENGAIDFGEMISHATSLVKEGRYVSEWRQIIIDEFQDISQGRYELVRALLTQKRGCRLFCVGDDWQAIYRFAGSSHLIMNNFRKLFGWATILKLDLNFRFNDKIADVSERFITKNPHQIRKNLSTLTFRRDPQIFLHWTDKDLMSSILDVISSMREEHDTSAKSLLILCRYNRNVQKIRPPSQAKKLKSAWGGDVSVSTIHASKGLEADFVIVADLNSEKSGFPSMRDDDPILNLVLSSPDKFLNSEERRLFYVALTRAKEQTHLIANPEHPSVFAEELANSNYKVRVTGSTKIKYPCPSCSDGMIVKHEFDDGIRFRCVNHPVCKHEVPRCDTCNKSHIARRFLDDGQACGVCLNESCGKEYEACPQCDDGILVTRTGYRGAFLGCHNFSRMGCEYTKPLKKD